jgi:hypothetical protein
VLIPKQRLSTADNIAECRDEKEDLKLSGTGVGRPRCDKLEKHADVVWRFGDQLRQDTIQLPRWEPYWSETCDALIFAAGTVERLPDVTMRSGQPPQDPVTPPVSPELADASRQLDLAGRATRHDSIAASARGARAATRRARAAR